MLHSLSLRDDEEAPLSSSSSSNFRSTRKDQDEIGHPHAHSSSKLSFTWPFINRHLETTPSPPQSLCLKKKALLIGIQNYDTPTAQEDGKVDAPVEGQLKGPHVDVRHMRQLLLGKVFHRHHPQWFLHIRSLLWPDCYGYKPDDITVLIDDGLPEHIQPTQENLVSLSVLVSICLIKFHRCWRYDAWRIS